MESTRRKQWKVLGGSNGKYQEGGNGKYQGKKWKVLGGSNGKYQEGVVESTRKEKEMDYKLGHAGSVTIIAWIYVIICKSMRYMYVYRMEVYGICKRERCLQNDKRRHGWKCVWGTWGGQ